MKNSERFFSKMMAAVAVSCSLFLICDFADAATRTSTRSVPVSRKNTTAKKAPTTQTAQTATQTANQEKTESKTVTESVAEPVVETIAEQTKEPELIISNKAGQFEDVISVVMESAVPDNSFAEQIRKQRAALAASEATHATTTAQRQALSANSHSCDVALRKCMGEICGSDFTKCATDGDTAFGDKLNKCRRNTECSGEEFSLFTKEIKDDRDMNVRLASYNLVIDCGNSYNACIMNECGTTYNKCLGKSAESAAIQKCSVVAKECSEADSGLVSRFGTAMGKLRENAEKDIKKDENSLRTLRDMMAKQCKSLGATFDERSFDCVYSIEFYAGENQSTPLASRKAYAGDSFICMQEYFGVNATTYRENAYRETRSQTAASSAMLGSGLGVAAGAIASGAIDRAIDTTKAKNALKKECEKQGLSWKECQEYEATEEQQEQQGQQEQKPDAQSDETQTLVNSSEGSMTQGCKLTFKQNVEINNVAEIDWHVDNDANMFGRYTNDKKTLDEFRIRNAKGQITKYITLQDLVKVNDTSIQVPEKDTTSTYQMVFKCGGWDNKSYIGFVCKHFYEGGNVIGEFKYEDTTYKIYDKCVSSEASTTTAGSGVLQSSQNKPFDYQNIAGLPQPSKPTTSSGQANGSQGTPSEEDWEPEIEGIEASPFPSEAAQYAKEKEDCEKNKTGTKWEDGKCVCKDSSKVLQGDKCVNKPDKNDLTKQDLSKNGISARYRGLDGSCIDDCRNLQKGEWEVIFDYGTVRGKSRLDNNLCFCQVTSYTPKGETTPTDSFGFVEISTKNYNKPSTCPKFCADSKVDPSIRRELFKKQ